MRPPALALALTLLLAAPLALAAEQPKEAPLEFRNGQTTAYGTIGMEPYLDAGRGPVRVEARITLWDMGALVRAETVMLALNLHGKEARLAIDGAFAEDGRRIPSLRQGPDDTGRQMQLFLDGDELEARATNGSVSFTFVGHATPKGNGQVHVGALVVAYDGDWVEIQSADGPAKLYGYSMVQSKAFGAGFMPFRGQGNTMLVVPLVFLALFAIATGGMAIQMIRLGAPFATATFEPLPAPAAAPPPPPPPPPVTPLPPPPRRVVIRNTEIELSPLKEERAPVVPVFGSRVSPSAPRQVRAFSISTGPVQGPLLPSQWTDKARSAEPEARAAAKAAPKRKRQAAPSR